MSDDGSTKDDVKVPEGEAGDKINKLFTEDGKDTSKFPSNTTLRSVWCSRWCTDVIILSAMGEEAAIDAKEAPKG
jgi:translation initiation factor 5A